MTINLLNVTAICHDSNKAVRNGTLEIRVSNLNNALATGKLFIACAKHHNSMRRTDIKDSPEHNFFTIMQGSRNIGEFSAATMVSEVGMSIVDDEIRSQLQLETATIRREKE